jgi:hypothetical protein
MPTIPTNIIEMCSAPVAPQSLDLLCQAVADMEAAAAAIRIPQNTRITDALIQDSDVWGHRFDRNQAGGRQEVVCAGGVRLEAALASIKSHTRRRRMPQAEVVARSFDGLIGSAK